MNDVNVSNAARDNCESLVPLSQIRITAQLAYSEAKEIRDSLTMLIFKEQKD